LQDSTASTDSSRRASAAANKSNGASNEQKSAPHFQAQDASEREQRDDDTATMLYSSDSEAADVVEEEIVEDDDGSSSDSDDGTMMSMVTEEVTGTSMGSDQTGAYDDEQGNSSTLDEALRLAAQRAGAQRLEQEQSSDEDDEEEVIPSFGWIKKGNQSGGNPERLSSYPDATQDLTTRTAGATELDMDMDMTNAVGRIIKPSQDQQSDQGEEDMSMDVTSALGGILSQNKPSHEAQLLADEEDAPMDEATMEFTTALGGIRNSRPGEEDEEGDELDDNEDMSMELTTVLGGVLGQKKRMSVGPSRRKSTRRMSENGDATMDMTTGLGAIVSSNIEREAEEDEDDGDATMGMEMTAAIGGILSDRHEDTRNLGQSIFRDENEEAAAPSAATQQSLLSPEKQTSPTRGSRQPSHESSSPGLSAFRGKSLRRSAGPQAVVHDAFGADSRTPSPEKLATPKSSIKSPKKATVSPRRGVQRMPSPRRPSATQSPMTTPKSSQERKRKSSVFHTDQETGDRTPSVVLTPRRLSGIGLDKSGLGSPRVAALFERRGSIGDSATSFKPGQRGVSFADPKVIADEIDKDRQWEQDKENGRSIMEREADGSQEDKEPTLNLREMIDSLSPKRNPLRGRKSLHVGSAAGLLGKRPFELDDDAAEESEDAKENDGVKRLKGHQGSPVKNIKLRNPPSKAETTGRALDTSNSAHLSSPVKSPRPQIRFREVDDQPTTREVDFESSPVKDAGQLEREADDERIHLQDFLNMTSIRFMELTTTKRRHTAAPSSFKNGTLDEGEDDMSLERCVVTGACTVPTLELYQHSCRELKKYISDGRRIVKEIETDTWEENPALFQEYISATPEVKALMDNQFKNVKTHARLKSKAGWYEWRTELQHGLKAGLHNIGEGMERDGQLLQKQKHLLDSVMPALAQRHKALQEEAENLEEVARELADCDPEELQSAREELADLDFDVAEKKQLIAELKQQLEESTTDVETLSSKKESCLADIVESERIREECRGWTSAEIDTFKGKRSLRSSPIYFMC
jgi:kinetochore protein Spc7/SPC105